MHERIIVDICQWEQCFSPKTCIFFCKPLVVSEKVRTFALAFEEHLNKHEKRKSSLKDLNKQKSSSTRSESVPDVCFFEALPRSSQNEGMRLGYKKRTINSKD